MKYIVQNILFPDKTVCDETELYYRTKGTVVQSDMCIELKKGSISQFSTYFNSFSLNKWLGYTKLDNLGIKIKLKGFFRVDVYSTYWYKGEAITDCLISKEFNENIVRWIDIKVDELKDDTVFFEITALEDGVEIYDGQYYTEINEEKLNNVEIDLVMCTFKREQYIKRNIELIKNHYQNSNKYNGAKHLKIKVVDNGQTLGTEIEVTDKIRLFPNLNTGGSGGFSRGMLESLWENKSTHILFMDDDVLVQVEAFERTYNLLRLLKDEHKNDFLGGAMLRYDKKFIQHENLSAFKGNYTIGFKANLDLRNFADVLFNEKYEKASGMYCGWWYCCIPKTVANLNNLPYPFFIRIDDMEYSIRNIKNVISLNGISVWHEPFDRKYSTLFDNYFMFRNILIINVIYDFGNLKLGLKFFLHRFIKEVFCYDYGGASLLLDGVEAFLQGPEFLQNVDTIEDLKRHAIKQSKQIPVKELKEYDMVLNFFNHDLSLSEETKLVKMIRYITWNGHLLPNCFFKDVGFAGYGYSSSKMYFCKKKVIACDRNFDTATVLEIDRGKFWTLFLRYLKLNLNLIHNYTSLKIEYKKTFKFMISEEFWKKYLKLDKR